MDKSEAYSRHVCNTNGIVVGGHESVNWLLPALRNFDILVSTTTYVSRVIIGSKKFRVVVELTDVWPITSSIGESLSPVETNENADLAGSAIVGWNVTLEEADDTKNTGKNPKCSGHVKVEV